MSDTKKYYDEFSKVYENKRGHGYHFLLDELEFSCLYPYVSNKSVLEAGCGTGLILERVNSIAKRSEGIDLSEGMLALAKEKGLSCQQAEITDLPFIDNLFDTVYSFKVLPHVPDIRLAIKEMTRVTKPGGHLVLEFYNPKSLRGLIKRYKPDSKITGDVNDSDVYTRYDTLRDVKSYLPENLEISDIKGVRIVTPAAFFHNIPILNNILEIAERNLVDSVLGRYGGFLIVICEKK